MKKINILLLLFLALSLTYCAQKSEETTTENTEIVLEEKPEASYSEEIIQSEENKTIANISIEGMSCAMGCAGLIQKKVAALEGVNEIIVDFEGQSATIDFDETKITHKEFVSLINTLAEGEYTVTTLHLQRYKNTANATSAANVKKENNVYSIFKEEKKKEQESIGIPLVFPDVVGALRKVLFPY
jgi:periplasmic mercuric ion binding protein